VGRKGGKDERVLVQPPSLAFQDTCKKHNIEEENDVRNESRGEKRSGKGVFSSVQLGSQARCRLKSQRGRGEWCNCAREDETDGVLGEDRHSGKDY
jgi:hypothetical protein